jgi:ribosome-binding protein aMBF1 (putative translation factor)
MIAPVPTAAQIRAARQLLGWKQTDLAAASGLKLIVIKNVELLPPASPIS